MGYLINYRRMGYRSCFQSVGSIRFARRMLLSALNVLRSRYTFEWNDSLSLSTGLYMMMSILF